MSKTCGICCEAFTKLFRKPIECTACHYEACMKCTQTYLVSNPNSECMSCHAPWTRDFIHTVFPKAWVAGAYTRFREGVLLDIEKARLPDSQYLVRNYRTVRELTHRMEEEKEEKRLLYKRMHEIDVNKWNSRNRIHRILRSRYQSDGLGSEGEVLERRSFIRACPVDGCRGFLSSALKCGTCETYACSDCFGVIGKERHGEHTCDPNDVETAKYIKKESRPCPTCAINISKIDGCDQMYCVQCRTAFSWRTGVIVTGTIHNPHYFEQLRNATLTGNIPRQPGDDDEGRCHRHATDPGVFSITLSVKLKERGYNPRESVFDDITRTQRHACHLFRDTLHTLRQYPADTADLRMQYLLGNYDETQFKRKLVLREKSIEKHTALISCYSARVQMTIDIVRAYLQDELTEKDVIDRLRAINEMMRDFLDGIQQRFKCAIEVGPTLREFPEEASSSSVKKQRVV